MLKKIENLPDGILGLRAEGTVTREDYETTLIPLLEEERQHGRRIRFLYQFGKDFSGFTAGAALDDFRVGLKYLRLFERCAVVTDTDWIRSATQFMGSLMPCPVHAYKNEQLKEAIEWVGSPEAGSNLKFEMRDDGVLIVHPKGPLKREDFDKLSSIIDPWIESHHQLHGVVFSMRKFPGWENVGSFIHHMAFVSAHHQKVGRVALAVDGTLPDVISKVASHFIKAEIKQFSFEKLNEAIEWASTVLEPTKGAHHESHHEKQHHGHSHKHSHN